MVPCLQPFWRALVESDVCMASRPADDSPYECAICLSIPDDEVHQCSNGHFFCADCLETHRATANGGRCPTCRTSLTDSPIRCRAAELGIGQLPTICQHCATNFSRAELKEHSCSLEPTVCDAAAAGCAWQGVRRDREAHLANCTLSICQRMVAPLEQKISQQQQCIEEQSQQMEQHLDELFHLRYVIARLQARQPPVRPEDLQRDKREERDYVTRVDSVAVRPGDVWMLVDSKWLEKWRNYAIDQSTDDPPGPITNYCLIGRDFRPVPGLMRVRDYRGMNQQLWYYFHERYGGGPAICRSQIDLYAPAEPLPPRAAS